MYREKLSCDGRWKPERLGDENDSKKPSIIKDCSKCVTSLEAIPKIEVIKEKVDEESKSKEYKSAIKYLCNWSDR